MLIRRARRQRRRWLQSGRQVVVARARAGELSGRCLIGQTKAINQDIWRPFHHGPHRVASRRELLVAQSNKWPASSSSSSSIRPGPAQLGQVQSDRPSELEPRAAARFFGPPTTCCLAQPVPLRPSRRRALNKWLNYTLRLSNSTAGHSNVLPNTIFPYGRFHRRLPVARASAKTNFLPLN